MSNNSVLSLLRLFANRQTSALVSFSEFCDYMRRYAQHHLDEQSDLLPYLSNTADTLQKELDKLTQEKQVAVIEQTVGKTSIIVIPFFVEKFTTRYSEIEKNPTIPFPVPADLPKHVPTDIIEKKTAAEFIYQLFEKPNPNESILYGIVFSHDIAMVLLPSTVSIESLLDISLAKIRNMLHKEESHDYFQKKVTISNPGKELTAKKIFQQFVQKPEEALEALKAGGESFYFWSQLCFFIRQDFEKVKDYTQEDISLLQATYITEIAITYYKNKSQKDQQREAALKTLESILSKPPYYFDRSAISKFVDSKGIPLLGQYSEDDLSKFLHDATTIPEGTNLPNLLTFKAGNDHRFFIYKSKVLPLIMRLCTDARETIRNNITKDWYEILKRFETIPPMKDQKEFEKLLEKEVQTSTPILYALLSSNFLSLVHYENRTKENQSESINLFVNGQLISYSELLLMSRQEILTDAKILLPFWYTIPIISWFISLICKPPKSKSKTQKPAASRREQEQKAEAEKEAQQEIERKFQSRNDPSASRKNDLRNAAKEIEKVFVPAESSLDRELASYLHVWNKLIGKQTSNQLTEDVNSLIRDYMRKVLRTLKSSSFTPERVQELAETLSNTSSMQKIKDHDQLTMYIELYIIKLVKSI